MANRTKSTRRKSAALTIWQHEFYIQATYTNFTYRPVEGGAEWNGTLQPDSDGPVFRVSVRYTPRSRMYSRDTPVQVRVEGIELNEKPPHVNPDGTLCLFYPNDEIMRWTPDKYIATTIIPWTAQWLQFYLWWKRDGVWYGPEAPHGYPESKPDDETSNG